MKERAAVRSPNPEARQQSRRLPRPDHEETDDQRNGVESGLTGPEMVRVVNLKRPGNPRDFSVAYTVSVSGVYPRN